MAATPAGTKIQATGTAEYHSATGAQMPIATSNTVIITVGQSPSVIVSPPSQTKHVGADLSAGFGVSVINTGPAADTFDLSAVSKSGSKATIYRDDNGDGLRQSGETTVISATGSLPSAATYRCIVLGQLPTGGSVTSDTVTFTARSRADATKTGVSVLTFYTTSVDPSYITSWLVNGYYANADEATCLSKDYLGGESAVAPVEGTTSGGRTWMKMSTGSAYLDLGAPFGRPNTCAGYAFAYVYAPSARTVNMWLGSDDGIKVWMNGQVVWTKDVYRSYLPDVDRTSVSLNQGWNKLLMKVSQGYVDWGFSVRLCDSSGKAIPDLIYALAPISMDDTTAPIISNVKATPAETSAVVEWDTDELASTLVDYGTTSSLGVDFSDLAMVNHHSATLSSLTPGATYYYKVGSADANGNTAWIGQYSFQTTAPPANTGAYVQTWLVNGYYPNSVQRTRLTMNYIGNESTIYPAEGMISGSRKWFRVDAPTNYLDMSKAFKNRTYCAGYAAAYVYSPAKQTVRMWIGSDDGTKVWLNGNVVWFNDVYRSFVFDSDKTSVQLKAGWNRLVIRMSQGRRTWGLSVKFCDSAGNQIPGIVYSISAQP